MGEGGSSATTDLHRRLSAGGLDVVLAGDEAADWAGSGPFDAAIDDCVADQARKERGLPILEQTLPPGAPLVSSCQAAAATALAPLLTDPTRLVGYALLAPFADRQTVECCRALQTADAAAEAAAALWTAGGFEPVWVGDSVGLVTPRIVACLANEAAFAVMEAVALPEDIDRAMELGTRYPRGPLAWAAEIGLARIVATLEALHAACGDGRYRVAPLLRHMAIAGAGFHANGGRI
jgi:3-hydroxybutyryl-CoA dehydrogenase